MNIKDDFIIREMRLSDLPEICNIQQVCYTPDFIEDKTVFAEKLSLFPQGCFIALLNNTYAGYIFSHPWALSQIAPLNGSIRVFPQTCDCLYIHDCAIIPDARKKKLGQILINKVLYIAKKCGYASIQLVSVQKSQSFWNKFGFISVQDTSSEILEQIKHYGEDAVLMRKTLT